MSILPAIVTPKAVNSFIVRNFVAPNLHMLFFVTVFVMAGITAQFLTVPLYIQAPIVLAVCILMVIINKMRRGTYYYAILPLSFALGSFLCYKQQEVQKKFTQEFTGHTITVHATVCNIEEIQSNPRFKNRITVSTYQIKKDAVPLAHQDHTLSLYVRRAPADLLVGDVIEITDLIGKEIKKSSFGTYLAKEKISATLFLDTFTYTLLNRPEFSIVRSLFYLRNALFYSLRNKINKATFTLFSSIFLGNRTAVKNQIEKDKESFKIWGISHHLARSGLHLVIFAMLWHFILNILPIAFLARQFLFVTLVLLYALLSWSSISFERALLMLIFYKLTLFIKTPLHYIHLITLVTLLVLLFNPLQLFFLDFQLSFGLTFALAWFSHIHQHKKCA